MWMGANLNALALPNTSSSIWTPASDNPTRLWFQPTRACLLSVEGTGVRRESGQQTLGGQGWSRPGAENGSGAGKVGHGQVHTGPEEDRLAVEKSLSTGRPVYAGESRVLEVHVGYQMWDGAIPASGVHHFTKELHPVSYWTSVFSKSLCLVFRTWG